MKLHIAICDDEKAQSNHVTALAQAWIRARKLDAVISVYDSAEAFLFAYGADKSCAILLLDIQMKQIDGVTLAKRLRAEGGQMQIVFITGFPDFMAEGYDVSALHYLMKPVKEEKLFPVLDTALARVGMAEPVLLLNTAGEPLRLLQRDILYIEALWPAVKIVTTNETREIKANLAEITEQLDPAAFVQCHRSYIAGLRYVKQITRAELILDGNVTIPLSRRLYHNVHQAFFNFYKRM